MPTSPFEHCSIISIRTFVEVSSSITQTKWKCNNRQDFQLEVNPSGLHRDLVVRSPIIVGSVPLRSTFSNFEMGAAKHKEDATPSNSLFRIYPDLRKWYTVHCWASRHSLGFEDEDLGCSPGWWAATVAMYCPSKPSEWRDAQQCITWRLWKRTVRVSGLQCTHMAMLMLMLMLAFKWGWYATASRNLKVEGELMIADSELSCSIEAEQNFAYTFSH